MQLWLRSNQRPLRQDPIDGARAAESRRARLEQILPDFRSRHPVESNDAGESVLTLGNDPEEYAGSYAEVVDLGAFDAPWIMDHEHQHYFWLRHRKRTYAEDWPRLKYWY